MIAFFRLAVFGLIGLSVLYGLVLIYARSVRREKLEKDWLREGSIGAQEDYVSQGLAEYRRSFAKKLILLVYIVPIVTVGLVLYVVNFS
ncbi:hypothetical protein AQS8620_02767 [Aquimixticola soesokkakensis]|uniref:Cation/multidrug efflux pump n=1 Tax=Aquimixticola soesokkakensis TaxID=1519096 RepID=A0A1Y5TI99_9RHOB|nr:hypothetical protein [Aquimixticola soesokkakensis]SLN60967.1 hypothetical protein AQS8620_02767 [Aquimixticola soesokkakensis]